MPTTALAATESAAAPTIAAERTVAPAEHRVALATSPERASPWRALFAAFDRAGDGANRYALAAEPASGTKLIVWDTPNATPPANWRAPHWWLAAAPAAAFPELANASALTINGITLKYADSPRGRLWTSDAFPPAHAFATQMVNCNVAGAAQQVRAEFFNVHQRPTPQNQAVAR